MNTDDLSLDELKKLADLTAQIRANLAAIESNLREISGNSLDLAELERQTGAILEGLRAINEDKNDIDELEKQTGKIVGLLRAINEVETKKAS